MTIDNVVLAPFDSKEQQLDAVKQYCQQKVEIGKMTQAEADKLLLMQSNNGNLSGDLVGFKNHRFLI